MRASLREEAGKRGFSRDGSGLSDSENTPNHLIEVSRGYFFNAKVPVSVDKEHVSTDQGGHLRDQFGSQVKEETDPMTGETRLVTYMPMIEASTRYIADDIDTSLLLLPFDTAVTADMQGETQQRVRRVGELKNKPNAMHILDAMRSAAMVRRAMSVEAALAYDAATPVLDRAV